MLYVRVCVCVCVCVCVQVSVRDYIRDGVGRSYLTGTFDWARSYLTGKFDWMSSMYLNVNASICQ